jgi:tetratricopeptide (TPR) repeat protein
MKSYSIFIESKAGCGQCGKQFKYMNPLVINAATDPQYIDKLKDLSLLKAKCEYCGYDATMPAIFLYHDPTQQILWAVSTLDYASRYLQLKNTVDSIISDYLKILPTEEAIIFRKLIWQYVPLEIFLQKIGAPIVKGKNVGFIHFYPLPRVTINKESVSYYSPLSDSQIQDYDVALVEGNYPDFYHALWDLLQFESQFLKIYIRPLSLTEPKKPIATYGTPEIMFYVGSYIVLPIFIGILSSLLASLILEKVKAKQTLEESLNQKEYKNSPRYELLKDLASKIIKAQENDLVSSDKVNIFLRVKQDKKEYTFSGAISEVYDQLLSFRKDILRSVRIVGDCHIVPFFADRFVNGSLDVLKIQKSRDLGKSYDKIFSKSTRTLFASGDQAKYLENSLEKCKQAKVLMEKNNYKEASILLEGLLKGEYTSIDVLYNYALCQEALGNEQLALAFYEQVLIRAINLPSLEESSNITPGMPLEDDS